MGRGGGGSGVEARGQSIRVTFYIGGERFRETLKLKPTPPNVRYAERLKKEIDAKIGAGVFDYAAHFPDSPNLMRLGLAKAKPSFRHYAELWYSSTGALSKGTRIQYRRYLNAVWIPLFGDRRIADIKHSEIAAYVGDHDWHSAKNLNNHLSALRGPFIMARKDRAVPEDPTEGIKNLKYQAPGADPLERDEVEAVLDDMRKHYHEQLLNYFEFAFLTGLRPEEQIALKWDDIDWRMETVKIRRARSYKEEKGTKTSRERDIELNERALVALRRQKKHTFMAGQYVFTSPVTGEPYPSSQQLRDTYWKASLKRVGIRGRDMYQTRHTYATHNLMDGARPAWIARMMGHTNMGTLLRVYTKWMDGADKGVEKAKLSLGRLPKSPQNRP